MRLLLARSIPKALFVFLFVVAAATWLYSTAREQEPTATPTRNTLAFERATAESRYEPMSDTDSDGLRDWQEALRGTDPADTDTDNDGTGDGDEVSQSRDPLKRGPDDTLRESAATRLSEMWNGGKILPKELAARVDETETVSAAPSDVPTTASPASEREKETFRHFGNALGAALGPVTNDAFVENGDALLDEAVTSQESAALKNLAPLGQQYASVADALKRVEFLSEGEPLRASLQESYRKLGAAVALLAQGETEPTLLGERWTAYADAVLAMGKALNEGIGFFLERGVMFGPNDAGRIFAVGSM